MRGNASARLGAIVCIFLSYEAHYAQAIAAEPQASQSDVSSGIAVISGFFGKVKSDRTLDITARAQQLCGTDTQSCQLFCSETSFGGSRLGHKAMCRITWRCDGEVRSIEAVREEPMTMRCPGRIAEPAVLQSTRSDY